jgi:hypothetical protein
MRDFKGMKRQRGRNRGSGGGSGKPQHNTNRAFDSNGPDGVKVRGAAQHVYEKYQQLARDAHTSGDRVLAENYLQHAEHYFRVMRAMQPQRPLSEIIGRDQFVSGYDIDFEDESGQGESADTDGSDMVNGGDGGERTDRFDESRARDDYRNGESRTRDDRSRDDRGRDDRSRDDRGQSQPSSGDRLQAERVQGETRSQVDRTQADRSPAERSTSDRPARAYRDDRSRAPREERPRPEAVERSGGEAMAVVEPEATPLPTQPLATVLRADDGDTSHAPAFLQVRPSEPRDESGSEPRRAPRRKRAPATFEPVEAAAPAAPLPEDV